MRKRVRALSFECREFGPDNVRGGRTPQASQGFLRRNGMATGYLRRPARPAPKAADGGVPPKDRAELQGCGFCVRRPGSDGGGRRDARHEKSQGDAARAQALILVATLFGAHTLPPMSTSASPIVWLTISFSRRVALPLLRGLILLTFFSTPCVQADGVRSAVEAMIAQYDESRNLQRLEGVDMTQLEDSAAPIVRMLTMLRNRDMLLCYLRHRMKKIESARWDVAGTLPQESLELLSPNEREYDREYANLLSDFQTAYDLDLMRDTKPPTDLFIKVLAKEEVGAFVGPESGATIEQMNGGDTVFLRRGDVEPLIRQGKLEHLAF